MRSEGRLGKAILGRWNSLRTLIPANLSPSKSSRRPEFLTSTSPIRFHFSFPFHFALLLGFVFIVHGSPSILHTIHERLGFSWFLSGIATRPYSRSLSLWMWRLDWVWSSWIGLLRVCSWGPILIFHLSFPPHSLPLEPLWCFTFLK